jgi:Tfp pilus assembly protein PilO
MSNEWIPKNKLLVTAFMAALVSFILYFGGLIIVKGEIKKVENLYNSTESESYKEEKTRVVKSISETNKDSIRSLHSFFIPKDDDINFIKQIEEIARGSAIKFEIISIEVKLNQTEIFKEDVTVRMDISGSWQNIMNFTQKLEKMPFGVLIEKFSINTGEEGWSGVISFDVFKEK